MKYIYTICIIFLSFSTFFAQSEFNRGFKDGYESGYCQDKGMSCMPPIPPIPPIPKNDESLYSYKDGYNRGFQMGLDAQKSIDNQKGNSSYKTSSSKFTENYMYNPYGNIDNAVQIAKILRDSKGRALNHLQNKNYQEVANICFSGLNISPKDAEFMILLAQVYYETGNIEKALHWNKKALKYRRPGTIPGLEEVVKTIESKIYESKESKPNSSYTNSNNKEDITEEKLNSFTDSRNNKIYHIVQIGDQTWMAENLAFESGEGCWNHLKGKINEYGCLYNWETAKSVCPDGWHLPSKKEFEILLNNVGGKGRNSYYALKPFGTSRFSALFGGFLNTKYETYIDFLATSNFWTSTENTSKNAWYMNLNKTSESGDLDIQDINIFAISVRCIKD